MFSLRKWLHRPKKTDTQLLAKLYYADDELNAISMELDSFDGREDPERCTILVNQLRNSQDKVLGLIENIMECAIPNDRANRDFRAKFPDDVLQDSLAGQLWFGAELLLKQDSELDYLDSLAKVESLDTVNKVSQELSSNRCLAAGSTIMQREIESAALRPLARALIGSLDSLRNMLKDQCLKNINNYSDKVKSALKHFDVISSEFELSYVSAMVPVKTALDYDTQQDVIILFCETVDRAVKEKLLSQEMIDDYDAALMFTLPRLVIVCGLVIFPDGPLNVDVPASKMSELFRPYRNVLRKIRELLCTLTTIELHLLEKALSSNDLSWEDIEKELIALNGTTASKAIPMLHGRANNHMQSPIRSLGHNDMFGQSPASVSTLTERSTLCSSFPLDCDLEQMEPAKSCGNDFSDQMLEYLVADSLPFSSSHLSEDNVQKLRDAKENVNNTNGHFIDDLPTIQVNNTTETNGDDIRHKRCRRSSERRRSSGSSRRRNSSQCNGDLSSSSVGKDSALTEEIDVQCDRRFSESTKKSSMKGDDDSGNPGSERETSSKHTDNRTNGSGASSELSDKEAVKKYYLTANGKVRSGGNTECSSREGSDDAGTTLGRKGSEPDENILQECKARITSMNAHREAPRTENHKPAAGLSKKSTLGLETCTDYTMTRFLSDLENVEYYDHTNQDEMLPDEEDGEGDVFYLSKVQASDSNHDSNNGTKSHTRSPSVASTGSSMSSLSQNRIVGHHAGAGLRSKSMDNHSRFSDDGEEYDDEEYDDECSTCSCSTCERFEAQNEDFKWESDDSDSDSTSYLSDNHDDHEIAMAIKAAEQAAKEETRSRFSSTSDLVHRLFVCVAGVADQLQSNYASDLRNILKTVFEVKCLDPFDISNLVQTLPENPEEETATFLNHINPSAQAMPEVFEERHRHGSGHSGGGINGEERCLRHNSGDRRARHNSNHSGRVGDEKRRHNSTRSRNKSGQRVEGLPCWQPDEQCTHCFGCKSQFTVLRRKHHCRNCGKIFCARCSANSVPLPRYGQRKAVRVCNRCYMFHVTPFQQ